MVCIWSVFSKKWSVWSVILTFFILTGVVNTAKLIQSDAKDFIVKFKRILKTIGP